MPARRISILLFTLSALLFAAPTLARNCPLSSDTASPPVLIGDVTASSATRILIASQDYDFRDIAELFFGQLLEGEPALVDSVDDLDPSSPVLLIADGKQLRKMRRKLSLDETPRIMTMWHSSGAWTTRRDGGAPVLVVTARDADSLEKLASPMPAYADCSYLFVDGVSVNKKGVWEAENG